MKWIKWLVRLLVCVILVAGLVMFGPSIWRLLNLGDTAALSSTVISEEMKEIGVLNSVNHTETGEMVAAQSAWLVGTAWRFSAPYTYSIDFGVDLDQATVDVTDNVISIGLPPAYVTSSNLEITGEVKTEDFWSLMSGEDYAQALDNQKKELESKYTSDPAAFETAWQVATNKLQTLLNQITGGIAANYTIEFAVKG